MSLAQKIAMGVLGIALATTLLLPDRQTVPVLRTAAEGGRGILATAMGIGKKV